MISSPVKLNVVDFVGYARYYPRLAMALLACLSIDLSVFILIYFSFVPLFLLPCHENLDTRVCSFIWMMRKSRSKENHADPLELGATKKCVWQSITRNSNDSLALTREHAGIQNQISGSDSSLTVDVDTSCGG
jgi:hypothetical protein